MRLSGWRAKAPFKDSIAPKVLAVVDAALDRPRRRPRPGVLGRRGATTRASATCSSCRPRAGSSRSTSGSTVPGEGPRASGKVVRWKRVQLGELAVEIQGGHRLVTFQVETQVLNGADADGRCDRGLRAGPVRRGRRPARADPRHGQEAHARESRRRPRPGPRPRRGQRRGRDDGGHAADCRLEGIALLIDAVIFDLDGVIVDSEIWWDEVRAAFAAAHGRAWTADDQAAVMGANSAGWARIMRERLDLDMPDADIERAIVDGVVARYRSRGRAAHRRARSRRSGGSPPTGRWRIASSAHRRGHRRGARRRPGWADVFAVVVSSDEVAHGKPAPDVYLEAARRLGVAPAACLVVEDSLNGVRAGKAAGMIVVLVPNASVPPAPGTPELADLVLDRLADLDPATIDPHRPGSRPATRPDRPCRRPIARACPDRPSARGGGRSATGSRAIVVAAIDPGVPAGPARGSRAAARRARRSTASTT